MCKQKTVNIFTAGFYATFGLIMVALAVGFKEYGSHETAYLNQIADDWDRKPFVELAVTRDWTCPEDTEEVFFKPWLGSKNLCVCNRLSYYQSEGPCPRTDDNARDCIELPALSPVIQAQFNGVRICGKRGGDAFLEVTRVQVNGKCPSGTSACSLNASSENTVCYPAEEHHKKCPITFIDIVNEQEGKAYESKSGYSVIRLSTDQDLVYSKTTDALPPTTIKIENKPCVTSEKISSAPGTLMLPQELMDAKQCEVEPNTGLKHDERYKPATVWSLSESDIMKENYVYERLYKQEPESLYANDFLMAFDSLPNLAINKVTKSYFSWEALGFGNSDKSRAKNEQRIWMRSTIPWKLDCDRMLTSREEAYEIFSMRLDHLGFIEYVIWLAVLTALLILVPMITLCLSNLNSDNKWMTVYEPLLTRLVYGAVFIGQFYLVDIEREQCHANIEKVQEFGKTNSCGDQYSIINTQDVTAQLTKADTTLDAMSLGLQCVLAIVAFEIFLRFFQWVCFWKESKSASER